MEEEKLLSELITNHTKKFIELREFSLWNMTEMAFHLTLFENMISSNQEVVEGYSAMASAYPSLQESVTTMQKEFHKTAHLLSLRAKEYKKSISFETRSPEDKERLQMIEEQGDSIAISPEEWKELKEEDPSYQDYVAWIRENGIDMEKAQPILEKHFPTISTGAEVKAMQQMPLSSLMTTKKKKVSKIR